MKTNSILTAALLSSLILTTGCGGDEAVPAAASSEAFGTVNGTPITAEEMLAFMQTKATVRALTPDGQVVEVALADSFAIQSLQEIVAGKLILASAEKAGVSPTDADIDAELKMRNEGNPKYIESFQAAGYSMEQLKNQVKTEMSQERLVTQGITVTVAEVDEYIKENPDEFTDAAGVKLDLIFVTDPAAQTAAQEELSGGASFEAVKEKYDVASPSDREKMTDPRGIRIEGLLPELRAAVDSTEPGQLTSWVESAGGQIILKIDSKTPQRPTEITEAIRKNVQRNIAMARGQATNNASMLIAQELMAADVRISAQALQQQWDSFADRMRSASVPPSQAAPTEAPAQ
jgi:parvulin-like peptidyl-prolyl isomerase